MLGSAVDEERLQRCKKGPRRIVDAILRRSILPEFSSQRGEYFRGTGQLAFAHLQPFEFSQKTAPRQWRQALQKLLNPISQHHRKPVFRDRSAYLWFVTSDA